MGPPESPKQGPPSPAYWLYDTMVAVLPLDGQPETAQPRPPTVPSTCIFTPEPPNSSWPKPAKLTMAPTSALESPSLAGRCGMGAASVTAAPRRTMAMSLSLWDLL